MFSVVTILCILFVVIAVFYSVQHYETMQLARKGDEEQQVHGEINQEVKRVTKEDLNLSVKLTLEDSRRKAAIITKIYELQSEIEAVTFHSFKATGDLLVEDLESLLELIENDYFSASSAEEELKEIRDEFAIQLEIAKKKTFPWEIIR